MYEKTLSRKKTGTHEQDSKRTVSHQLFLEYHTKRNYWGCYRYIHSIDDLNSGEMKLFYI